MARAGPVVLALTVSVSGTSSEVENLYRVLDAEPRLFVINNFSLTPTATISSVTLNLDVFYAFPDAATAASYPYGGLAPRAWRRLRRFPHSG